MSDTTTSDSSLHILHSTDIRPVLKLIPPTVDEFTVYGNAETVERAKAWAMRFRYLLARGVPACAHGLYLMTTCPTGLRCCEAFDHTNLWVPDRSPGARVLSNARTVPPERPFLLTHPYLNEVPGTVDSYARAHGLRIERGFPGDDWYGFGTLPIRLTPPDNWPLWPIEREADSMFSVRPVLWPDDEGDLA